MKQDYKELHKYLRNGEKRLYAALLSRNVNLRQAILSRYGSTKFSIVSKWVRYGDQLRFQYCLRCKQQLGRCKCKYKDIRKWLNVKGLFKLLKYRIDHDETYDDILSELKRRINTKNVPKALTKEQWILWKVGLLEIDKCQCGKLKAKYEAQCYMCNQIKNSQATIKKKYGVDNISQLEEVKKIQLFSYLFFNIYLKLILKKYFFILFQML